MNPRISKSPGMALPGRIGDYELLGEIGRGQSATVYRARDAAGKTVAIKVLSLEVAENPRRLVRFYQEARLAMQIAHPNVVQVFEVGLDGDRHFLAMEYVPGESLARLLNREGALPETRALEVAIALSRGVAAVHKLGIVHRDVGPRNVLVSQDGTVKLGDLEFSKQLDAGLDLTAQGCGIGTPDYMAPEQFRKAAQVDHRADVYALGATLYVLTTGRLPFPGKTDLEKLVAKVKNQYTPPRERNPRLSTATADLIQVAMAASPVQRPPTAKAFKSLAKKCLARLEASSTPVRVALPAATLPRAAALWTVVSLTASGQMQRQQLTAGQVAQQVRRGLLGADTRAALGADAPFVPLAEIPVFCDLFLARRADRFSWTRGLAAAVRRSLAMMGRSLEHAGRWCTQFARRRTPPASRRWRATDFAPPSKHTRQDALPAIVIHG